jgi:3-methyl-2-oxobutanoate hydroxymethyltransferase
MTTEPKTIKKKPSKRAMAPDLMARKGVDPIVCLTAYTAPIAGMLDPYCDVLLVGDSVGMVMYGMDTTLEVSLDMMINHGKAVVRGSETSMVIIDMPFATYEESPAQAFRNCARVMAETGANGIKLEGGEHMADTIAFLVKRGIPVMAHIGLTPQSFNTLGGFKAQGREVAQWDKLMRDAKMVADAGAFATVLEGIAEPLAVKVTKEVQNLTIGIGASVECDGQIVVTDDMLGMFDRVPKFVKKFGNLKENIENAAAQYAKEVKEKSFPAIENTFSMKKK